MSTRDHRPSDYRVIGVPGNFSVQTTYTNSHGTECWTTATYERFDSRRAARSWIARVQGTPPPSIGPFTD